jgi:hypothetical protein
MIDAYSRFMILNLALRLLEPKMLCSIAAAKANLATNPVFDRLDIMRLGRFYDQMSILGTWAPHSMRDPDSK